MFNVEFLHIIREYEYTKIVERFSVNSRILEIGGGTGYQAKRLTEDGFIVESIDMPDSNYACQLEFLVRPYDGKNIPFPDDSFDVVFSSNVLEHVKNLPHIQSEIKRVLKPEGFCLHLMPSGAWRFWTNIAHYIELFQRLLELVPRVMPRAFSRNAIQDSLNVLRLMVSIVRHYAIVPRHGENGNALTEIVTFSARHWMNHFIAQNYIIEEVSPTKLFYTGHMILGSKLSIKIRQRLARLLGSACLIYIVRSK